MEITEKLLRKWGFMGTMRKWGVMRVKGRIYI